MLPGLQGRRYPALYLLSVSRYTSLGAPLLRRCRHTVQQRANISLWQLLLYSILYSTKPAAVAGFVLYDIGAPQV